MNAILDTNVIVSGALWKGIPSAILDAGKSGAFSIGLTPQLLHEIEEVLRYERLRLPLLAAGKTPEDIIASLEQSCLIKSDVPIPTAVKMDPTDDMILGAALSHRADYIVSGDRHLLNLKSFARIPILTPRQFLKKLNA